MPGRRRVVKGGRRRVGRKRVGRRRRPARRTAGLQRVSFPCWLSYRLPLPRERRPPWESWEVRRDTASKKPWIKHKTTSGKEGGFHSSEMSRSATLTPVAETDPVDAVFETETPPPTPVFAEGEQTYIHKARYSRKTKRQPLKKTRQNKRSQVVRQREVKEPKKKAFRHSDVIKGGGGVMPSWATTLHSLLKHVWWMKKPLLKILKTGKLVDGKFLHKKTTLRSLMNSIPLSRIPLVDLLGNKTV